MGVPVLCATFTLRRGASRHFGLRRDKSACAPGMHAAFVHPWPINCLVAHAPQPCVSGAGSENAP